MLELVKETQAWEHCVGLLTISSLLLLLFFSSSMSSLRLTSSLTLVCICPSLTTFLTLIFKIYCLLELKCVCMYDLCVVGRLAKEQASQEQLDAFMSQEREKRRTLLNKFIQTCSASKVPSLSFSLSWNSFKSSKLTDERLSQKQVKVETILVESDSVAKAIQDLTTILNIKKLVLGIDKSNARYASTHIQDDLHKSLSCQMNLTLFLVGKQSH